MPSFSAFSSGCRVAGVPALGELGGADDLRLLVLERALTAQVKRSTSSLEPPALSSRREIALKLEAVGLQLADQSDPGLVLAP